MRSLLSLAFALANCLLDAGAFVPSRPVPSAPARSLERVPIRAAAPREEAPHVLHISTPLQQGASLATAAPEDAAADVRVDFAVGPQIGVRRQPL